MHLAAGWRDGVGKIGVEEMGMEAMGVGEIDRVGEMGWWGR